MTKVTTTILGEHNSYIVDYMNILENFMWTYIFTGVSFEPSTKRLMAQQEKGEWEKERKIYPGEDVCNSPSSLPVSCAQAGSSLSITLPHLQHAYTYLTYGLQSTRWAAQRSFLLQNAVQNLCGMLAKSVCQEQSPAVWLAWKSSVSPELDSVSRRITQMASLQSLQRHSLGPSEATLFKETDNLGGKVVLVMVCHRGQKGMEEEEGEDLFNNGHTILHLFRCAQQELRVCRVWWNV